MSSVRPRAEVVDARPLAMVVLPGDARRLLDRQGHRAPRFLGEQDRDRRGHVFLDATAGDLRRAQALQCAAIAVGLDVPREEVPLPQGDGRGGVGPAFQPRVDECHDRLGAGDLQGRHGIAADQAAERDVVAIDVNAALALTGQADMLQAGGESVVLDPHAAVESLDRDVAHADAAGVAVSDGEPAVARPVGIARVNRDVPDRSGVVGEEDQAHRAGIARPDVDRQVLHAIVEGGVGRDPAHDVDDRALRTDLEPGRAVGELDDRARLRLASELDQLGKLEVVAVLHVPQGVTKRVADEIRALGEVENPGRSGDRKEDHAVRLSGLEEPFVLERILPVERILLHERVAPGAHDVVQRPDQRVGAILLPGRIAEVGGLGYVDDLPRRRGEANLPTAAVAHVHSFLL